jgi:hypothetical protein
MLAARTRPVELDGSKIGPELRLEQSDQPLDDAPLIRCEGRFRQCAHDFDCTRRGRSTFMN